MVARRSWSRPSAHRSAVLGGRASAMRAAPTSTEALLWEQLRGSKLGVGFRRQVVIGPYIVDFCAPSARLVVEVDGGYHAARARQDARRDRWLEREGWRVLRVDATELLRFPAKVTALITRELG
jgi:very-short-patch-repair endonuclease